MCCIPVRSQDASGSCARILLVDDVKLTLVLQEDSSERTERRLIGGAREVWSESATVTDGSARSFSSPTIPGTLLRCSVIVIITAHCLGAMHQIQHSRSYVSCPVLG
jgi:hypothetical protein